MDREGREVVGEGHVESGGGEGVKAVVDVDTAFCPVEGDSNAVVARGRRALGENARTEERRGRNDGKRSGGVRVAGVEIEWREEGGSARRKGGRR